MDVTKIEAKSFEVFFLCVLTLFSLQKARAESLSRPQIVVRESAVVSSENVKLGDIAKIEAGRDDNSFVESLVIGGSPKEGERLRLTAQDLSACLRAYENLLRNYSVKLPRAIEITRTVRTTARTSEEEIRDRIKKTLSSSLPDSAWELEVSEIRFPNRLKNLLPADYTVIPPATRPKGVAQIEIRVLGASGNTETVWASARVRYFAQVGVLKRRVDAHSHLDAEEISWQKKDVTFLNEDPCVRSDLANAEVRLTLMPGNILVRTQLEREAALKFGQEVEVVAGDSSIQVRTKGIAQQAGVVGDIIKVRAASHQKLLSGTIIDRGVVRVQ